MPFRPAAIPGAETKSPSYMTNGIDETTALTILDLKQNKNSQVSACRLRSVFSLTSVQPNNLPQPPPTASASSLYNNRNHERIALWHTSLSCRVCPLNDIKAALVHKPRGGGVLTAPHYIHTISYLLLARKTDCRHSWHRR
jgi:hypothetical protein